MSCAPWPPSSSAPARRGANSGAGPAAWEIGAPMDDLHTETSADAPLVANGDATPVAAGPPRRPARPPASPTAAAPAPLAAARRSSCPWCCWSSSSSPGWSTRAPAGSPATSQLAGVDIGGLTEDELAGRVGDVAADFAATPVELRRRRHRPTRRPPARSGLMVDEDETAAAALEVGEDTFVLARPFEWARSLVHDRRRPAAVPGERGAGGHDGRRPRGRRPHAAHRAHRRAGRRRVRGRPRRRRRRHRSGRGGGPRSPAAAEAAGPRTPTRSGST